jgi:DNA helicase IV
MRQRAEALLVDLRSVGSPDLDYQSALQHRVNVLADSPRPLLFGRIDEEAGPSWHIGRRHVEDDLGDPVVVDWRAPISVPFYQARIEDPRGLTRRRQVIVDRGQVVAIADDLFGTHEGDLTGTRLRGGDALLAELERARTGEMLDIVATIQAEQDEIIRAPLDLRLAVQGGPGTGKTAVGLHRAAFLLYNHPPLIREGVLVLGPSRAFLRYIAQVLPSLGEEAVVQSTVFDIAPRIKVKAQEADDVRRLKGDPRMATLLARALHDRRGVQDEDIVLRARFTRCCFSAVAINELCASIAERPAPYKSGRLALRARLVSLARQELRESGRFEGDSGWFEKELTGSDEFKALLDHLWPSVSATALVNDLLSTEQRLRQLASGLLAEDEWPLLLRPKAKRLSSAAWTSDDVALVDEAEYLINGRTRSYGHIVVDEAQDLSPMQFRMVARRAPNGSLTILGDLAQATGPWGYGSWDEILEHLPASGTVRRHELTQGYRAPGQILDLASRLLPVAAPAVTPTQSIRRGRLEPRIIAVDADGLLGSGLLEAVRLAADFQVGLIVAPEHVAGMTRLVKERDDVGLLEDIGMEKRITLVSAPASKGLEFDAVVVVEPAAIAGVDRRGLRLLYVALTRPIQHLSMVHALPLPAALVV